MMEQPSSSKQPDSSHDADNANTSESKPEGGKSEEEEIKTNPAIQKTKYDNSKKENDKTVTFSDTQIEISDTEDEDMTFGNRTNPRITISGPVTSPCEEKKPPCEEPAKGRCPIYYGIKSYIHDFYYPPDKEVLKSGEYIQEDDFQFLVEPGKRRWRGCWFRVGLWVGVNLMLVGIIAMLVGHMTAPRQTVVSQQDYTVVDRWAVNFNNRLIICQLAGLAGFTSGAVIVMLVLLVSSYQQDQSRSYYVMAATVVPETFVGNPLAGPKEGWGSHRIPLSGVVRGVQPCFHGTN